MRRYAFSLVTLSELQPAVSAHFYKFRMAPLANACQQVEAHQLLTDPAQPLQQSVDAWGNALQYGCCLTPHTRFCVESRGIVRCTPYRIPDPTPSPLWLCASPLAAWDEPLRLWARQLLTSPHPLTPHQQALALMHGVHRWVSYQRFSTDNATTALQVFHTRLGVCQDYAHLMIAACRSLGLPARYANGLVVGQGETHAWVEVHDGEAWLGYDPTYDVPIRWGYIQLAHGRDVSDCPTNRGRFYSWTRELMTVSASVHEL